MESLPATSQDAVERARSLPEAAAPPPPSPPAVELPPRQPSAPAPAEPREHARSSSDDVEVIDGIPVPSILYRPKPAPGRPLLKLPRRFIGRIAQIVPVAECMVPKDHHPAYKGMWIESRRNDGTRLKEDMCATFELELLFSALFLGVIFPAAIGLDVSPDMRAAFREFDVSHHFLSFVVVLMGAWCSIFGVLQIVATYLSLQAVMPISDDNVYAFLKMRGVKASVIMVPNVLLVCQFYSGVFFIGLLFVKHILGEEEQPLSTVLFVCAAILGPLFGLMMLILMPLYSYAYNLSHLTGCFGERAVVPQRIALALTAEELEEVFARRAIANLNKYGHAVPDAVLDERDYVEEDDDEGDGEEGEAKKPRKKPMKRAKQAKSAGLF